MKTLIIIWSIFCLVCGVGYIYVQNNIDKQVPITTNYLGANTKVTEVDKSSDPDTAYTIVVNYYANKDNSGAEMLEIKITTYTDYEMSGVYSTGIQIINPEIISCEKEHKGWEWNFFAGQEYHYYKYNVSHNGTINYFNSVDGIAFEATDELNSTVGDLYIIDIDNKPFAFNFEKRACFYQNSAFVSTYRYVDSSFDYFTYQIYEAVKSFKNEGVYSKMPLKFDDVFQLYEYNSFTGKFDIQSTQGYSQEYFAFKFNVYNRGAMTHEDSIYEMIGTNGVGGVIWAN